MALCCQQGCAAIGTAVTHQQSCLRSDHLLKDRYPVASLLEVNSVEVTLRHLVLQVCEGQGRQRRQGGEDYWQP